MKTITKLENMLNRDELEKLIALTKQSNDLAYRFYYLRALRKLGEYHIMLSFISEYQMELYSHDAPTLIRLHIDALIEIGDFDQALNVLKQYDNFPYFSMETNEVISELGERVQKKRKEKTMIRDYNIQEIERRLSSDNYDLMYSALEYINANFHDSYLPLIAKVLKVSKNELSQSILLITLKEHGYKDEVMLNKFMQNFNLSLDKLHVIGEDKPFLNLQKAVKEFVKVDDDLNVEQIALELLLRHTLFLYPLQYQKKDQNLLVHYFYYLALGYQGRTEKIEEFCARFNLEVFSLNGLVDKYYFRAFRRAL